MVEYGGNFEYGVNLPDATTNKDLNTTCKILTITKRDIITRYNGIYVQVLSNFVRVESKLYEDRFVHFVRLAQNGDKVAFQGISKAEMKKTILYNVHLVCDSS